jgi:hypothetical protein
MCQVRNHHTEVGVGPLHPEAGEAAFVRAAKLQFGDRVAAPVCHRLRTDFKAVTSRFP